MNLWKIFYVFCWAPIIIIALSLVSTLVLVSFEINQHLTSTIERASPPVPVESPAATLGSVSTDDQVPKATLGSVPTDDQVPKAPTFEEYADPVFPLWDSIALSVNPKLTSLYSAAAPALQRFLHALLDLCRSVPSLQTLPPDVLLYLLVTRGIPLLLVTSAVYVMVSAVRRRVAWRLLEATRISLRLMAKRAATMSTKATPRSSFDVEKLQLFASLCRNVDIRLAGAWAPGPLRPPSAEYSAARTVTKALEGTVPVQCAAVCRLAALVGVAIPQALSGASPAGGGAGGGGSGPSAAGRTGGDVIPCSPVGHSRSASSPKHQSCGGGPSARSTWRQNNGTDQRLPVVDDESAALLARLARLKLRN